MWLVLAIPHLEPNTNNAIFPIKLILIFHIFTQFGRQHDFVSSHMSSFWSLGLLFAFGDNIVSDFFP